METRPPRHHLAALVALATVLGISVTAALPLFWYGVPQAFDTPVHLARLGALDVALRQGAFYPRWLPNLLLGHGYPLFNYYAPAAYYVAVAWLRAGANAGYAYLMSYALFLLVAGPGMYLWARAVYARTSAGVLAATAYVFAPYLLLNTYVRGSFAETLAIALLPWVFWSFRRLLVAANPWRAVPPAALTLGALAVSHTITLLLAPPVLIAYLLVVGLQGRTTRRTAWAVVASLLLAMGISAFFWLPLILERGYLSDAAYTIARFGYLPGNVWRWDNFVQRSLRYVYNDNDAPGPVQMSAVQLVLAAMGFGVALVAARHNRLRRAELWLWLGVLVVAGLCVGTWALPLWQSNRIFAVVQFPWRLLVIMGLPLALAAGGLASAPPLGWLRLGAVMTAGALVIWAHYPRLALISFYDPTSVAITLDHVAQIEQYKGAAEGGENTSSVQEFKPRWVARTLQWDGMDQEASAPLDITPLPASGWSRAFVVEAAQPMPLRLHQFYFPGWRGQNNQEETTLYQSTNLGLLTVDLAAGSNQIAAVWRGTWVEGVAVALTLLALAALVLWCWRVGLRRGWLALWLGALVVACVAAFVAPRLRPVELPAAPLAGAGLELVGLRTQQMRPGYIDLYPTWYVAAPLSDDLELRWQVADGLGSVLATWQGQPFYNSYAAANLPRLTLVEDAYQLPLPGELAAGTYLLRGQLMEGDTTITPAVTVGALSLDAPAPPQRNPTHVHRTRFDEGITLTGYDVHRPSYLGDRAVTNALPVVESGEQIEFTLWWLAEVSTQENFHGFVHLVDNGGRPIEQVDQLPGPVFQPPMLWNGTRPAPDVYDLTIPPDTASGLYWPWVGLYRFPSGNRLLVQGDMDHVELAPIKVVNREVQANPATPVAVGIGDFAAWVGYDLAPDGGRVQPGASFTLTLYYEAERPSEIGYTRFVHVIDPNIGVVAQSDAVPQHGANPTWAWQAGEVVVDVLTITLPPDAPAGSMELRLGFYAPEQGGTRVPLRSDEVGRVLEGDQALIGSIVVE